MSNSNISQCNRIEHFMRKNGSITQAEANQLKVARLASRIYEMRKRGCCITVEMKQGYNEYGTTRYAVYTLKEVE